MLQLLEAHLRDTSIGYVGAPALAIKYQHRLRRCTGARHMIPDFEHFRRQSSRSTGILANVSP
jgi:hypothetical protein